MERDEIIEKYNLNLEDLKEEQENLSKQLEIKDEIDFNLIEKIGAIENKFFKNKILSAVILCGKDFEISDKAYIFEKTSFPYLPEFRAYRELPGMVLAFNKLNEKPDVVFIFGQGIIHPRLGLASHFSLSTGIPTIGISDSAIGCEIKGDLIYRGGKKVGKVLQIKPGSRPIYVSPGNKISIDSAYELSKKFINLPHKFPEPMHLAGKYSREIKKELNL